MIIKPAHKIFCGTHRKRRSKPNIRILPPLLWKNKYGRSQLYWDQIFSHPIYLYNRKFDWCLIVHPIWLVLHTSLTDPLTEPPITYPTRRLRGIFLQKNNSKISDRPAWLPLYANVCFFIFAFRGCYCLGSFILQDLFQVSKYLLSRDNTPNFPWTFSLLALYFVTPGSTVSRTVCKQGPEQRGVGLSFWTLGKGWVVQFLATRGGWVILFLLWELTHIWHNLQVS